MRRTLFDKLWDSHVVTTYEDGSDLLYIDRHLVHEVSSPQAFQALEKSGRRLRRPETHLAVADHAVPTRTRADQLDDPLAQAQVDRLKRNISAFDIPYIPLTSGDQGIVHVVGPELGFTLPGATLVCGDSHTSTHGAFGALAFGIGASECGIVMATQCLRLHRPRTMRVVVTGTLGPCIGAKDMALALIAAIGSDGATGYAIEFQGEVIAEMSMASRMTLCNLAIEAGARVGLIAPDETTYAYLKDRPLAPRNAAWTAAVDCWRTLASDPDAVFDRDVALSLDDMAPFVTWGTSPEDAATITARVPDPAGEPDPTRRARQRKALSYMNLEAGAPLDAIRIDRVFIGSCTNGRIEDLRAAAAISKGRRVAPHVTAIVSPGSTRTKQQAEAEGLDAIFIAAGFEWRHSGCSMCVAMNDDRLAPGERCASTSNRNFEGRQGAGGRTHLMSPAMAAAAAIAGRLVDVRTMVDAHG